MRLNQIHRRGVTLVYLVVVCLATSITTQACFDANDDSGYFDYVKACIPDPGSCGGAFCRMDYCANPSGYIQFCIAWGYCERFYTGCQHGGS